MSETPPSPPPDTDPLVQSGDLLNNLLTTLYPEPGPDILTLADFRLRYRLTGLGPLAIQAIQQAQRVNRATGRFEELGLCEFHIGLIYLYWKDFQGAVKQFQAARQQWSFVNKTAVICLAHFAEGIAQHHRFAYEEALAQYGKVENCCKRMPLETYKNTLVRKDKQKRDRKQIPSESVAKKRDVFSKELKQALKTMQNAARAALWPQKVSLPLDKAEAEQLDARDTAVPLPQQPIQERESPPDPGAAFSPPINNQSQSPVPGHVNQNPNTVWYRVRVLRQNPLFPGIKDNGWLLVNRQINNHIFNEGDPIVIISDNPEATVVLEPPPSAERPFSRICLARTTITGSFTRETSGHAQLSADRQQIPVTRDDIFGIAIGLWLEAGYFEILDSRIG